MVGGGWLSIVSQVYLNQCNIIYASLSPFYSLENTMAQYYYVHTYNTQINFLLGIFFRGRYPHW